MNKTGRLIVLGAAVMLVLGADLALEKAFSSRYHPQDGAEVSENPPPPSDSVASAPACDPTDMPA